VLTKRKGGFETPLEVPAGLRFAAAAALDRDGRELGSTSTIRL